jgi:hypothetical protein
MSPRHPTIPCLATMVLLATGCGDDVLDLQPSAFEPENPRPAKSVFHRCKPHVAPPSSSSADDVAQLPLLYVSAPDQTVDLDFGDLSSAGARFHMDILVWENGEACGQAGVRTDLTADSRSSDPWGPVWSFVGGGVKATLEGGELTRFEVDGELCSMPDQECRSASLLAHELTHAVPERDGAVVMDLRLVSGADEARFHAHGHLDFVKKVGNPAT